VKYRGNIQREIRKVKSKSKGKKKVNKNNPANKNNLVKSLATSEPSRQNVGLAILILLVALIYQNRIHSENSNNADQRSPASFANVEQPSLKMFKHILPEE
tara:strand:- start:39339 stop:39641 length:303 start_codon:yes stop_codon:yes gene_type:complete